MNHRWTLEQVKFLQHNFQKYTCQEIADKMGLSLNSVKTKRKYLGLIKTDEALRKIYSRQNNSGFFKKGQQPVNLMPEKSVTMRLDDRGVLYKWIKIAAKKWEHLHLYLWKKTGNEIPAHHVVRFKDGDTLNCVLQNLELTPKYKHLALNRDAFFEKNNHKFGPRQLKKVREKKVITEARNQARESKKIRRRIEREKPVSPVNKGRELFLSPKRNERVLATKKVDLSKCIAVKVDHRTTIYVRPGTDIEKIKSKYTRA